MSATKIPRVPFLPRGCPIDTWAQNVRAKTTTTISGTLLAGVDGGVVLCHLRALRLITFRFEVLIPVARDPAGRVVERSGWLGITTDGL